MAINRSSLSEQVYDQLRNDILSGQLPAGKKLLLNELKEQYGVSITPLREALSRLAQDRFVDYATNQGARVVELTTKDIGELLNIRNLYDQYAIQHIMQQPDTSIVVEELKAAIQRQWHFHDHPEHEKKEYDAICYNFHAILCAHSGNDRLIGYAAQINSLLFLADGRMPVNDYPEEAIREHEYILSAIEEGNCVLALEKLQYHLENEKKRFKL